jgi:hypothetical protein
MVLRLAPIAMLRIVVAVATVAATVSAAVPLNQVAALNDLFSNTSGKDWYDASNWGVGDPCVVRCEVLERTHVRGVHLSVARCHV